MALNRAQLLSEITNTFVDNTSGLITPANLRGVMSDVVNNVWTLQDGTNPSGTITLSGLILTGLTGVIYGNGSSVVTALANGQIPGTATSDNASAGNIGEFMTPTVSNVALGSGTPATIASVTLTGGDWDVWGDVFFSPAGTTTITGVTAATSTVNNTLPAAPAGGYGQTSPFFATGVAIVIPVGVERYSVAGSTPIYLVAQSAFLASTMTATAKISARRAR